jgi:hypothetical protein
MSKRGTEKKEERENGVITTAAAMENLVVNSRIPPPFANRLFGEQCRRW